MDDLVQRYTPTPDIFNEGKEPDLPDWLKGVAFLGYRGMGWAIGKDGENLGSGAWGDEIILRRDRKIVTTRYPAGYSTEAAVARGAALKEQADTIARMREALEWYESRVSDCRKLGGIPEGETARNELSADGGERARHALKEPSHD